MYEALLFADHAHEDKLENKQPQRFHSQCAAPAMVAYRPASSQYASPALPAHIRWVEILVRRNPRARRALMVPPPWTRAPRTPACAQVNYGRRPCSRRACGEGAPCWCANPKTAVHMCRQPSLRSPANCPFCNICTPNTVCRPGYGGPGGCVACAAGTFSLGGNATAAMPACVSCPINATSLNPGAKNAGMCSGI